MHYSYMQNIRNIQIFVNKPEKKAFSLTEDPLPTIIIQYPIRKSYPNFAEKDVFL